jgi:hypothetical protein
MDTVSTRDTTSTAAARPTPAVLNPRSPWFWGISGIGLLLSGIGLIALFTWTTGLAGPGRAPPVPTWKNGEVETANPFSERLTAAERKRVLEVRLARIDDQLRRLENQRQRLDNMLKAAETKRPGQGTADDLPALRTLLNGLEARRAELDVDRIQVTAALRGE